MLRMAQNQICIDFIKINIISIVLSIHLLRSSYYVRLLFCVVDIVERQLVSSQFGDFLAEAVGATSKFSVNKKRNTQYSV